LPFDFFSVKSPIAMSSDDPLQLLRTAISSGTKPIPTVSSETPEDDTDIPLSIASHLFFPPPYNRSFALNISTRFVSSGAEVDLRSIYFAWLTKDEAVHEYIAATQKLNDELGAPGGLGGKVQNLVFIEKLDLITWLEGASEESEHIKPLTAAAAQAAAEQAGATAGAVQPVSAAGITRPIKRLDPRLAEIFAGERKLADMNSILRGIKPTVS
jgi:parafibromin